MKMQQKKHNLDPVVERLQRYHISQGMPWRQIAAKLGVSRGMLMMVLREDRRLSSKALYKLELAEQKAADHRSAAQRIVESLIGEDDVVPQILGEERDRRGSMEVSVQYETAKTSKGLPPKLSLSSPAAEDCRKLRALFAETLDTKVIALACLPKQFRSEGFLNQLTAESRTRLTNAALSLVIPDWRSLVTNQM